jgi:predicted Rossmann fold nucleotide-binding protein DprA/Smf involved in DNA uptake
MVDEKNTTLTRAENLRKLREMHNVSIERTQKQVKDQKQLHQAICQFIREEAKTVPEIAAQIGKPSNEVLWYLMSMKKYGIVVETGICGDYPLYKRIQEKEA